jgi:NDP-sugar pyrophosphorylase family protein
MRKYELTGISIVVNSSEFSEKLPYRDVVLYRIRYLIDIPKHNVKAGDLGGFLESERNLSSLGSCVVLDDALVCDNAYLYGNSVVRGTSIIYDTAHVYDDAKVLDNARVGGSSNICRDAVIGGDMRFHGAFVAKNLMIRTTPLWKVLYGK